MANTSWTYGYDRSRGLISDYYSTHGYHGAKVKDLHDGSYEYETTNTSGKTVYTNTPTRANWSGQFWKYE